MPVTWKIFFTIVSGIVITYYSIIALLLYRKEIFNWMKTIPGKKLFAKNPVRAVSDETGSTLSHAAFNSKSSSEEEPDTILIRSASNEYILIGSVADLLHEIKSVAQLASENRKTTSEIKMLFQALLARYSQLSETHHKETINIYLIESCKAQFGFDLQPEEVNAWWTT